MGYCIIWQSPKNCICPFNIMVTFEIIHYSTILNKVIIAKMGKLPKSEN